MTEQIEWDDCLVTYSNKQKEMVWLFLEYPGNWSLDQKKTAAYLLEKKSLDIDITDSNGTKRHIQFFQIEEPFFRTFCADFKDIEKSTVNAFVKFLLTRLQEITGPIVFHTIDYQTGPVIQTS